MIVGPFPATLIAYKCTNVYLFAGHYETNNQHLFHNYLHQFHISCKLKLQFETNLMIMLCVQLHKIITNCQINKIKTNQLKNVFALFV